MKTVTRCRFIALGLLVVGCHDRSTSADDAWPLSRMSPAANQSALTPRIAKPTEGAAVIDTLANVIDSAAISAWIRWDITTTAECSRSRPMCMGRSTGLRASLTSRASSSDRTNSTTEVDSISGTARLEFSRRNVTSRMVSCMASSDGGRATMRASASKATTSRAWSTAFSASGIIANVCEGGFHSTSSVDRRRNDVSTGGRVSRTPRCRSTTVATISRTGRCRQDDVVLRRTRCGACPQLSSATARPGERDVAGLVRRAAARSALRDAAVIDTLVNDSAAIAAWSGFAGIGGAAEWVFRRPEGLAG